MPTAEDLLQAFDDSLTDGARRGMMHNIVEDEVLDGRLITLDGRQLVNFGSCSYLGLEMHPALREGVIDAVTRYGSQFSASRSYVSAPAYREAEQLLTSIFLRPTLLAPSTTMGHVSTVPVVVGSRDTLLMDHQLHHSVQMAAKLAAAQGTTVELLQHNDLATLESRVAEHEREAKRSGAKIWYAVDGLYSMYADFAPIEALDELMNRYPSLWLYVDDAHAMSWCGTNGRGYALDRLSDRGQERSIVAGSLNKSFASSGGAISFPDDEMRRRVLTVGGPLIFSGPVQPPMLGAVIASAKLHLSDEVAPQREHLLRLIRLFNSLADEAGLPLVSPSEAPIRCVAAGRPEIAYGLSARLREAGYYTNTAIFPAVAAKRSGTRVAITSHLTEDDVRGLIDALAEQLPLALAAAGSSVEELERSFARQLDGRRVGFTVPSPRATDDGAAASPARPPTGLTLQVCTTITAASRQEWDALFGDRGAFDWAGLAALEAAFASEVAPPAGDAAAAIADQEPESDWRFMYFLVRDSTGAPVAATYFTTALWKDDMLSAVAVSEEVERRRVSEPYALTSVMVGMGSLLTEGDHLWLDRSKDWRAALRLILNAARAEEDYAGAAGIVLRDLPDGVDDDGADELHDFLVSDGFARIPIFATWERELDFAADEEFLAGIDKRKRYHQRHFVLGWEDAYDITTIDGGSDEAGALPDGELDHLYRLYRNVHANKLELNVYPLPRRLFDALLASPAWQFVVLRLKDGSAGDRPIAFAAQHLGSTTVQPLFVGLDYAYVASHHSYQQLLWQAVRTGVRRGATRVLFGMSADLHKSRFGAHRQQRWAYVQATDMFNADVLMQLQESLPSSA